MIDLLNSDFEELVRDPSNYRIGPDFRATHKVFPVRFRDEEYVLKVPKGSLGIMDLSTLANSYYALQRCGLFCNFNSRRFFGSVKQRLSREAAVLHQFQGDHAPALFSYHDRRRVIVEEYLKGRTFRNMGSSDERKYALNEAIPVIGKFHETTFVGDLHARDIMWDDERGIFLLDFEGNFDERDLTRARAKDLLNLVYTVWTVTRDEDVTIYAAKLVSDKYPHQGVKNVLRTLVSPGYGAYRLWFPTRIPLDEGLNKEVKEILKR